MKTHGFIMLLAAALALSMPGHASDDVTTVKKAVERSTLNQAGTQPFHLKATIAPSLERDKGSGRTGEVEIWWASPTQWKREVRSPEFHQVAIFNNGQESQKNEGDYFPEWLREISVALIDPVPSLNDVLEQVKDADVKKLMGSTYFSWTMTSTDGTVQSSMGAGISITDSTGLIFYGGGLEWGGLYKDYKNFHGRMVGRTVSSGSPEVTAKITTLEDLKEIPAGFFDVASGNAYEALIHTAVVEETSLRKNLLPMEAMVWPPLKDGPLEGAATTKITIDRKGKVREIGTIVANNSAVDDVARAYAAAMQFKPYLENGAPVQVVARITLPFKTTRPAGMESFESAQTYFERGRRLCFPAAGTSTPYLLRAEFQAKTHAGTVETGQYVDTWLSDSEWRREASIGNSRYVRTRHGEKRYQLAEGPDAGLLQIVLREMEPIPAIDTFVESDWKIKRDALEGTKTVRVLAGYESPEGTLDQKARGYWFDENGKLLKTYFNGVETRRSEFEDFRGIQISHEIQVLRDGKVAMLIHVPQIAPAETILPGTFQLPGHEWARAFTSEAR
jgi:hypothetical protein